MLSISLEQAESLVRNRRDLSWDGWTIVHQTPHGGGWLRKDGVFNRLTRRWAVVKFYEIGSDGRYNVPRSFRDDL